MSRKDKINMMVISRADYLCDKSIVISSDLSVLQADMI